jgi:hypothetical protein
MTVRSTWTVSSAGEKTKKTGTAQTVTIFPDLFPDFAHERQEIPAARCFLRLLSRRRKIFLLRFLGSGPPATVFPIPGLPTSGWWRGRRVYKVSPSVILRPPMFGRLFFLFLIRMVFPVYF